MVNKYVYCFNNLVPILIFEFLRFLLEAGSLCQFLNFDRNQKCVISLFEWNRVFCLNYFQIYQPLLLPVRQLDLLSYNQLAFSVHTSLFYWFH